MINAHIWSKFYTTSHQLRCRTWQNNSTYYSRLHTSQRR